METPSRFTFRLECIVPPGKTASEAVEWVQRFFDFHHPSLEAKATYEKHVQIDLTSPNPDSTQLDSPRSEPQPIRAPKKGAKKRD